MPQTVASDALDGEPQLAEVDADRAFALPTAALPPGQHINTEQYQLVPHVDPEGDGKAVRFYMAQNRETGQFDWSVPPGSLDEFISAESKRMNIAAYSRTFGGTTPSNVEVQRMLRDGTRGDVAGMFSHFGRSWKEGLKDPLFYLNMLGGVAGGSAAKTAVPSRAIVIAEGSSGRVVAQSASSAASQPLQRPMPGDPGFIGPLTRFDSKILFGEAKPGTNNIIGAHSPDVLTSPKYQYQGRSTNADGTVSLTQFKGEIVRKDGSIGMSKSKPMNTVAPSTWTNGDILRAGETAANAPGVILRNENGVVTTSHIEVVNGVQWQVLKENGVVTSSFPTGGRPIQ